jgi:hypothetical protein
MCILHITAAVVLRMKNSDVAILPNLTHPDLCHNRKYAQKWNTKLYNYEVVFFASVAIGLHIQALQEKFSQFFFWDKE